MRPTGRLHLGHYSVLENWVKLQDEYDCHYGIVDWHAMTTSFDEVDIIQKNIREMALDWLTAGLDPEKSAIFVQSQVKEHAELHLLFSMVTPLSWLERVPTYKEQLHQFGEKGKDISTYGFLGYPLLQAADILVYRAEAVPVGEDQIPHIELTREIARRFNYMYRCEVFPEPQALLSKVRLLPGIDNRKMSKSYNNSISLAAPQAEIKEQVSQMITDPARIRKDDPGHPEVCTVYKYHTFYNQAEAPEVEESCKKGTIGCVACKKCLAAKLDKFMEPLREKRAYFAERPEIVDEILADGAKRASKNAAATMILAREAMGLK